MESEVLGMIVLLATGISTVVLFVAGFILASIGVSSVAPLVFVFVVSMVASAVGVERATR